MDSWLFQETKFRIFLKGHSPSPPPPPPLRLLLPKELPIPKAVRNPWLMASPSHLEMIHIINNIYDFYAVSSYMPLLSATSQARVVKNQNLCQILHRRYSNDVKKCLKFSTFMLSWFSTPFCNNSVAHL